MLNTIETIDKLKEAVTHNDIAVVDLYATWCKPCQEMLPVIEELSNQTSVPFFKVDIDEVPEAKTFTEQRLFLCYTSIRMVVSVNLHMV